jgi:hypothetical protein
MRKCVLDTFPPIYFPTNGKDFKTAVKTLDGVIFALPIEVATMANAA